MPLMFISLKHGERIAYAVYMYILQKVLSYYSENVDVIMMYDIACTLQRHLKAHDEVVHCRSRPNRLRLAIPVFHAYGHRAECELTLAPLRCSSIGLSDGEVMESIWSFLRRFSRMTKEMWPSHRLDILSSALNYYGYTKKQKLYLNLTERLEKAQSFKAVAEENLKDLVTQYKLNDCDVLQLVDESRNSHSTSLSTEQSTCTTWEYTYFIELQLYYELKDEMSTVTKHYLKNKLEHKITRFEQYMHVEEKKRIWSAIIRRHFLLRQKAKYADGQKIANKLSKQITKLTTTICGVLSDYNSLCIQIGGGTLIV